MQLLLPRSRGILCTGVVGLLVGTAVTLSGMYASVWIAMALGVGFMAFVVWLLWVRRWATFSNCCSLLLGLSVFPQSIWSKGINVCISDVVCDIMFLWLIFGRKIRVPRTYFLFVGMYLVYCLLSFTWSEQPSLGFLPLLHYVEYLVIAIMVFYNIDSLAGIKRAANMYVLFASAIGLLAIVLGGGLHHFSGPLFVLGLQKNALGQIVGDALPVTLALMLLAWNKNESAKRYYISLLINLFALILSLSRGAMLGTVVGVVVVLLFSGVLKRPRFVFGSMAMVAALGFVVNWYISNNPKYVEELSNMNVGSSAYLVSFSGMM